MKSKIATLLVLVSAGLHLFLTNHYYQIQMGTMEGESSCNISSTLNCDTVASSDFASVLDIPVAALGFSLNAVLFFLLIILLLGLNSKTAATFRTALFLSGLSALASLVMGIISLTQMSTYCIYCIALYILSFVVFGLLWTSKKQYLTLDDEESTQPIFSPLADLKLFSKTPTWLAVLLISIPGTAVLTKMAVSEKHAQAFPGEIKSLIKDSIYDWKNSREVDFSSVAPSLKKGFANGSGSSPITIVEFADFRCGHCAKASAPLSTFVKMHKDVQLHFYNFPLDGACNSEIKNGDGASCRLAKAVHCAAKQKMGWQVHDILFKNQGEFFNTVSSSDLSGKIKKITDLKGLKWDELNSCIDSPETHEAIKSQADIGKKAGVTGTPKIYMNNKALPAGQLIPVLKAARKEALKSL